MEHIFLSKISLLENELFELVKKYQTLIEQPVTRQKHYNLIVVKTEIQRVKSFIGTLNSKNQDAFRLAKFLDEKQKNSSVVAKDVIENSIKQEILKIKENPVKVTVKNIVLSKRHKIIIKKRMCSNKVMCLTKSGAEQKIKNNLVMFKKTMRAYHCPICSHYHLTSKM